MGILSHDQHAVKPIAGVKMALQALVMISNYFVLHLPYGIKKTRLLKKDILELQAMKAIMAKM